MVAPLPLCTTFQVLVHRSFLILAKIFNQISVRTLAGPLKDTDRIVLEVLLWFLDCVLMVFWSCWKAVAPIGGPECFVVFIQGVFVHCYFQKTSPAWWCCHHAYMMLGIHKGALSFPTRDCLSPSVRILQGHFCYSSIHTCECLQSILSFARLQIIPLDVTLGSCSDIYCQLKDLILTCIWFSKSCPLNWIYQEWII